MNPLKKNGYNQLFYIKTLFSLICVDINDNSMKSAAIFGADNIKKTPI